jgi:hypothetical protein
LAVLFFALAMLTKPVAFLLGISVAGILMFIFIKQKRIQLQEINNKLLIEPIPTPINIQQIAEIPKIDKRTRRGKKQALTVDIKPLYETRKEPLELQTIKAYIDKANIIHRIFKNKPLSQEVKAELKKLLNDNPNINEPLILAEMDYIKKDIESTIQALRTHYKNDNSFKNYMNILVVISSHLKSIDKNIYQTLTKTNIFINKEIQSKREDNEVAPKDEGKIIDLDKTTILTNIQKLDNNIRGLFFIFKSLTSSNRNLINQYKRL